MSPPSYESEAANQNCICLREKLLNVFGVDWTIVVAGRNRRPEKAVELRKIRASSGHDALSK